MNFLLSFLIFKTPGKSFASWVLFLEQKSYLSYINLDYKIYTTILKNHLQQLLKTDQLLSKAEQYYAHFVPFEI